MNKLVSSKHLQSISDLTLTAPIKQGFIDAFETVTYETRLAKLLEALFKIRSTAREYSLIKPFTDTAERIQSLLDYRLAILDTEPRRLMLTATFDKPFEPYMRLIWDPLGPLLDVIFCNCEGYVTATGHSFPDYLAWVRSSQVDTNFFYSANGYSVGDVEYLLKVDRLEREMVAARDSDPEAVAALDSSLMVRVAGPEVDAQLVRRQARQASDLLGLEALVSLYRLTDFYPPDQPDGDGQLLRRATQQLLRGWGCGLGLKKKLIPEQLAWFWQGIDEDRYCETEGRASEPELSEEERKKAKERSDAEWLAEDQRRAGLERLTYAPGDIQGGILNGYGSEKKPVRLGALLMMRIVDPARARAFIHGLDIQQEPELGKKLEGGPYRNLAFTRRGLANIGVAGSELAALPQEFLEGMEERAGLLGDVRESHPRNWALPDRNWPGACRDGAPRLPVEMSEIDFVIQLRTTKDHSGDDIVGDTGHPLHEELCRLGDAAAASGVQLLAVQPMRRADPGIRANGREHFGFSDGISQPRPVDRRPARVTDEVARGEVLLGYPNDRSDPPQPASEILDNGTFLVVRKLSQDVGALRSFVRTAAKKAGISEKLLSAKLMGRTPDGDPLPKCADGNGFDFERDQDGRKCPFQSHIRRTNPRAMVEGRTRRPTPRILRRGLSYGARLPDGALADDGVERGVVFMAYNASIAEQYEVIQRWVNGGNSTGVASWQNDPLMGVPADNGPRVFRFNYDPESDAEIQDDPGNPVDQGARREIEIPIRQAFVELQWGMYLFVPSMKAIEAIVARPQNPLQVAVRKDAVEADRGREIVARLLSQAKEGPEGRRAAAAAWKICLEDFNAKDPGEKAEAPAIWAAIRRHHGGVLRVPYGIVDEGGSPEEVVLVAGKDLVMRCFRDPDEYYSMRGQMVRMKDSFGEIFLGMDKGSDYAVKSLANGPIFDISTQEAFAVARAAANDFLENKVGALAAPLFPERKPEIDLRREFITSVLAGICNHYFGIPDALDPALSKFVDPLGWGWQPAEARHPRCPGDFMATSRYCFYPDPVPRVKAYGQAQGRALRVAVRNYLDAARPSGEPLPGKLTEAIAKLTAPDGSPAYISNDELARTIIGVMTGFLPPADGCMRWALYEWIQEKTIWRVQQDLLSHPSDDAYLRAEEKLRPYLERAMQKRPAPDLLWRTAIRGHDLGGVAVAEGERIFVSIVSALAEDAAAGITDVYPVFGGDRAPADGSKAPLHACPAYKAAMGTMLGMLSALLESGRIETLPAPLLVKLGLETFPVPPSPPAPPPADGNQP